MSRTKPALTMGRIAFALLLALVPSDALVIGSRAPVVPSGRAPMRNIRLEEPLPPPPSARLGATVDQDGKSNVWVSGSCPQQPCCVCDNTAIDSTARVPYARHAGGRALHEGGEQGQGHPCVCTCRPCRSRRSDCHPAAANAFRCESRPGVSVTIVVSTFAPAHDHPGRPR